MQTAPLRKDSGELEGVLNGLANMQLGERQVLGVRDNLVNRDTNAAPKDGKKGGKPPKPSPPKSKEVINLISDDEGSRDENARAAPAAGRLTKAARLAQIAREVAAATDNVALAGLVRDFARTMEENRSRMLTKEGFAVLDALHKQLADPSVFVGPIRTARARASGASEASQGGDGGARETRQGKMNKLWRLGQDVRRAAGNEQLAALVVEFGAVINGSSGRTVTKDGFGFLAGLAGRLDALA